MGGSGSEELNKYPSPFPAVLWFVNVHEKKSWQKKKKKFANNATKVETNT